MNTTPYTKVLIVGVTYTVAEILTSAQCTHDYPALTFRRQGVLCTIKLAHVSDQQTLSVPGFAEARFTYTRNTEEEVPVFSYAGIDPIERFVDIEVDREEPDRFWVTPKGFPRAQYV